MTLNEKIKKFRKEKGWTQEELSKHLDITPGHVTRLENGNFLPSVEVVKKLSKLFTTSIDYLLDDSIDNEYDQDTKNLPLSERIKLISLLEPKQQEALMTIIDSMIKEKRIREILDQNVSKIKNIS